MSVATIEMLERAAEALGDLVNDKVVFIGGATIALWATDQVAAEFRPTDDVDVIVEVASPPEYYRFPGRVTTVDARRSWRSFGWMATLAARVPMRSRFAGGDYRLAAGTFQV